MYFYRPRRCCYYDVEGDIAGKAIRFMLSREEIFEFSLGCEDLDSFVASVRHSQVAIGQLTYINGFIKLTWLRTLDSKLHLVYAHLIEDLDAMVVTVGNDDVARVGSNQATWVVEVAALGSEFTGPQEKLVWSEQK